MDKRSAGRFTLKHTKKQNCESQRGIERLRADGKTRGGGVQLAIKEHTNLGGIAT
jgi:hypothetical protein